MTPFDLTASLMVYMVYIPAKPEVSSFTSSGDMEGSQYFKSRSRDPPLDLILHFFDNVPVFL